MRRTISVWLIPLLALTALHSVADSHQANDQLTEFEEDRSAGEVAEDFADSGTIDDALFLWGVLTERLSTELDNVGKGISTFENFADLVGDAGAALGGDARELGRIQRMIEKDTETINGQHNYNNEPIRLPTPIGRRIESEDSNTAMGEYARVEEIASKKLASINEELTNLDAEHARMERIVDATKFASDNGVKLEDVIENIVASGLGVFSTARDAWFDMALVINPALSHRENAAEDALKRIEAQQKFLQEQRARLENTRDWMNTFWWYELMLSQEQKTSSAGLNALDTAIGTQEGTASAATTGIATNLISTRINSQRTQELVAQLLADAAKADSAAAKHARMMQVLALANAAGRAYQATSSSDAFGGQSADAPSSNSGVVTPSVPAQQPTQIPLPADPGNGVPIGGTDLTLNSLPDGMESNKQMLSDRFGIPEVN